MKKVNSSNLDSHEYNPQTKTLTVNFKSGKTYEYSGVSPQEYDAFDKAPSAGQHLHQFIASKKVGFQKK